MREILFRGKRIDNSMWLYGSLRQYKDGTSGICDRELEHTYRVDPNTVGEYTGLTDKNGKKIFEGDLITTDWWHGHNAKVVFACGAFRVYGTPLFSRVGKETYGATIVGNVWDNPELMEGD